MSLFVLAAVVVCTVWLTKSDSAVPESGSQLAEAKALNSTVTAAPASTEPRFQKLVGRWVRPDGGYVLEIKSAQENGILDAAYFNPNPIHVARAEASQENSALKAFIELRDVNYPGSTYTLTHDATSDQLQGVYYQAVNQERFSIYFQRLK